MMKIRIVTAVALSLAALLGACSTSGGGRSNAPVRHAEYLYDFESLEEMTAASSAVIEGTVVKVAPGEVTGGECTDEDEAAGICEGDGAVQNTDVSIVVDELLSGHLKGDESTVTVVELPSVELPATPDAAHGFFFLYGEDGGYYSIINPEGRFIINDSGQPEAAVQEPDSWIRRIESSTQQELREQISEAAAKVASGKVSPPSPSF